MIADKVVPAHQISCSFDLYSLKLNGLRGKGNGWQSKDHSENHSKQRIRKQKNAGVTSLFARKLN